MRIKIPLPKNVEARVSRTVWCLQKADWKNLKVGLTDFDWENLNKGTAEDALNHFLEILWYHLVKFIPQINVESRKGTHPWLNDRCRAAILKKNNAEGTEKYEAARVECIKVLGEAHAQYIEKIKIKLSQLPRRSKQWWRLNRILLRRQASISSIPSLREGGTWLSDAKAKADAFAKTFAAKAQLPPEVVDTPFFATPDVEFNEFIVFRSRTTKRLLDQLDVSKATGHDKISASILKCLSDCIAVPFTKVCRRLFHEGCWPTVWKFHLVVPIFKRGAAFKTGNYRGVHLTTILSKLAEKLIAIKLVPLLRANAFGESMGVLNWAELPGPRHYDDDVVDPRCLHRKKDRSLS